MAAYHARADRTVASTGYDADRCFDDYRLGQLQGPFITTLGAAYATAVRTEAADRMFVAMATRPAPRSATSAPSGSGLTRPTDPNVVAHLQPAWLTDELRRWRPSRGQRVTMLTPAVPGAP